MLIPSNVVTAGHCSRFRLGNPGTAHFRPKSFVDSSRRFGERFIGKTGKVDNKRPRGTLPVAPDVDGSRSAPGCLTGIAGPIDNRVPNFLYQLTRVAAGRTIVMNLKQLLQGDWLGHPLHPVFVSLPVALWPTAMVCDLLAAVGASPDVFGRMALVSMLLGLAGAMLSIPTGLADWWEIQREKRAWKLGLYHMLLNVLATIVWATNVGLRIAASETGKASLAPLTLSIVGALLIGVSTGLGGRMVYDQGTGIARTSKKRWRRIAKAAGARLAGEKD